MLTCNTFAENTVGATQQVAACKAPHLANIEDHQLLDEQFLLLVIDTLNRLAAPVASAALLTAMTPCDAADALRNASCVMLTNTPAFPLTTSQLQAIVLWQLNELLCNA